jgi:cysteine desulfurase
VAGKVEAGQVVVSAVEHPSVLQSAQMLQRRGTSVARLRVSTTGVVDEQQLAELLEQPTSLVSVQLANHETGVIQPIERIAQLCRKANVVLHTDAVQAVGKMPVDFRRLGVSALTLTAHKLNGPVGIGALLVRSDVKLEPTVHGGFQQGSLRPGTEPVALAVGFHEALRLWTSEAEQRRQTMMALRDRLTQALAAEFSDLVVAGRDAPRLPHTANLAFPGVNRQALVMALDLAGVACSTGSACASGSSEPSPVLTAMGLPQDAIEGAIRLSLGAFTTADEIDEAAKRIIDRVKDLRRPIKLHKTAVSPS